MRRASSSLVLVGVRVFRVIRTYVLMSTEGGENDNAELAVHDSGDSREEVTVLTASEQSISKAFEASLASAMAPVMTGMQELSERLRKLEEVAYSSRGASGEELGSPSSTSNCSPRFRPKSPEGEATPERRASPQPQRATSRPERRKFFPVGSVARRNSGLAVPDTSGRSEIRGASAETLEPLLAGDLIHLNRSDDGAVPGFLIGDFATERCGVQALAKDDEVWLFHRGMVLFVYKSLELPF